MRTLTKKSLSLFVFSIALMLLSGCQSKKLQVLIPTGSPEYAMAYITQAKTHDVTVVSGADALLAGFADIGYDIIIAPVNLGAKMYGVKQDYQLSGVITWGNYYLISEAPIDLSSIDRMEITAFGENQIPDFMLKFILNHYDIEATISYLDSVSSITSAYTLDSSKIYLIAEPSMSILSTKKSLQSLDLQTEYKNITGEIGFPQAGVFVKSSLSDSVILAFNRALEASIDSLKHDSNAQKILESVGITLPSSVFNQAVLNSNIEFVSGMDAKDALVSFFTRIYDVNPAFIGQMPEDSFYR